MSSRVVQELIDDGARPPEKDSQAWLKLVADIERERGYKICAARRSSRNDPAKRDWPCERRPVGIGNGRCRFHGGTVVAGPGHVNIKHGRYSKALQGLSLAEMYDTLRQDPELLALTDDIALIVARQGELLSQLRNDASTESGVWDKYLACVEQYRRLLETEQRRRAALHTSISVERANLLLMVIVDVVRRFVPPEQINALRLELNRLRALPGPYRGVNTDRH